MARGLIINSLPGARRPAAARPLPALGRGGAAAGPALPVRPGEPGPRRRPSPRAA